MLVAGLGDVAAALGESESGRRRPARSDAGRRARLSRPPCSGRPRSPGPRPRASARTPSARACRRRAL